MKTRNSHWLLVPILFILNSCSYYTRIPINDDQPLQVNELRISNCHSNYILCPGTKVFVDNGSSISGKIKSIDNSKITFNDGRTIEINKEIKSIKVRRFPTLVNAYLIAGFFPAYLILNKKTVYESSPASKIDVVTTKYQKPEKIFGNRLKVECN